MFADASCLTGPSVKQYVPPYRAGDIISAASMLRTDCKKGVETQIHEIICDMEVVFGLENLWKVGHFESHFRAWEYLFLGSGLPTHHQ